jgi:hypothetical protein
MRICACRRVDGIARQPRKLQHFTSWRGLPVRGFYGLWRSAFYLSNFFRGESPVTCPHHALNLAGIARTDDGSRNDRQA